MPKEGLPTSAATIDDERKPISQHNETSSSWNYLSLKSSRDNVLPKGPREALISSKQNKADYASPKGSLDNVLTISWEALISGKQNKADYTPPKGSWSNKPEPTTSWDKEPTSSWNNISVETLFLSKPGNEPTSSWDTWNNEPTSSWDNTPSSSWNDGLWSNKPGNEPTSSWDNAPSSSWNDVPPKSSWETIISSKQNKVDYAPPKGSWGNESGNEPTSSWDNWDNEPTQSWGNKPTDSWDTTNWVSNQVSKKRNMKNRKKEKKPLIPRK
ncbi:hypothetical protein C1646_663159 [Rhizophagus diaphanus]|nr:hypothetical protein C1646_663159 [Rhizophagus diaphanus] [Rhizophagus sp. MUCL 43196]